MARARDWDTLLRQEPPRVVPNTLRALVLRGERRWQVSLVVLAVICGYLVAVFFPWPIVDDIRLDLGATEGEGVVLESVYAKRTLGDGAIQRRRLVFLVTFRFEDDRGREHVASSLFFGHVPPGTEVAVEFLPSNPDLARIKDGFFVPGGLWEVFWNVTFVALPLLGFWNYRRWRRRRLALLVDGVLTPGTIERVWRDQPHDHSRGWIEVDYVAAGTPLRLSQMVERETYRRACALVARELPVRVLYAAHAPREHLVVELLH